MNLLVTIPFSHYCEKARWALDFADIPYREEGHLPILSRLATRRHRGGSVPVLVTAREVLRDSTDILAWIDRNPERRPDAALYPEDPGALAEVLAREELLDDTLGPHARRFAYVHLLADRALADAFIGGAPVPGWERRAMQLSRPLAIAMMRRGLKLSPEGARRSEAKIREVFATLDAHLAEHVWLSGARFGAADITLAALAGPVLFPAEYPLGWPPRERLPQAMRALADELSATRTGQHALRCYREYRR